ncbi:TPR repeat region-containing protein [Mycobacteroides abscessus]|uniref:TPR repeat region-containing protein n=1 Tax=Mycobacteroides abscessus TaxID=36809 RepID=UPI0009260AC2|nr:hypothetical protein [Mycobacteroides abscessus]SIN56182.1 Uncharacterised protein [Mycobacteroides abscessus subsp. abscessus]
MAINLAEGLELPQAIEDACVSIIKRGNALQDGADTLDGLTKVSTWEGESGEAARRGNDINGKNLKRSAMDNLKIAASGKRLKTEAQDIADRIRALVADAVNTEPSMDIDLRAGTVQAPNTEYMDDDAKSKVAAKVQRLQGEITNLLTALELVDADLAQVIKGGTGQNGIDLSSIGERDAKALMDGTLTAEQAARMDKVFAFSPEELSAYKQGKLTIPAADMAYADSVMRSLDGQSPTQIKTLLDKAGLDYGKFNDAMNVVSDPKVIATGTNTALKRGDYGYIPAKGSFENLPSGVRDTLTKLDGKSSAPAFDAGVRQDFKDLASIMDKGNPAMMQGSELDHRMLGQTAKMLDASNDWQHNFADVTTHPEVRADIVNTAQDMLRAGGRDQVAFHDLVTGGNGQEFVKDFLTQGWTDQGAAARSVLHELAGSASLPDGADAGTQAVAQRAGETVHAIDQWAGNAKNSGELLNVKDMFGQNTNQSIGQLSPELVRGLAEANAPYTSAMVGNDLHNTQGFGMLDNPADQANMPTTTNLFSVLNTDAEAAKIINGHAYADAMQMQQDFANNAAAHQPTADLQSVGSLRGIIDGGANLAAEHNGLNTDQAAKALYEAKSGWFDTAKGIAGNIPGVSDVLGKIPDPLLKDMFVGTAPDPTGHAPLAVQGVAGMQHSLAQQLLTMGVGEPSILAKYAPDGVMQSFQQSKDFVGFNSAIGTYLQSVDPQIIAQINSESLNYSAVIDHLPK